MRYDLIILGNETSGLDAALAAVQLHKRVAIIAPPKSEDIISLAGLREAAMLLTSFRDRERSTDPMARRRRLTIDQLRQFAREVDAQKTAGREAQLRERGVDLFVGSARFLGPHEVEVRSVANGSQLLHGDKILLAVGMQSERPDRVPFDGETIFDSDEALSLDRIPRSMIVVGGGPVALECATCFALLGTRVAVVDAQRRLLDFCDREVCRSFRENAAENGVRFRLGRSLNAIERTSDGRAAVRLDGGKSLVAECVLFAASQRGLTDSLDLAAAGLLSDEQGRLWCNEFGQTWVKHIYGVGAVVGFPAMASLSTESGTRAVRHAFEQPVSDTLPVSRGLLTTPELAMVGATEQQLRDDLVAYEVGVARFRDTSRGQVGGSATGMLKLLFHRESLELLGVHCLGESASEWIRLGQTVMSLGSTIEAFRDENIFSSAIPECFRLAADDGLRRLEEEQATPKPTLRIWRPRSRRRRLAASST
ncbi:putative soluble pyridine nucleotide transhydrogenase [Planctomycetia bacterium]|nr:putative soluble pyridine nucleotide transhydrogenase [Planctomycetia bacterium]